MTLPGTTPGAPPGATPSAPPVVFLDFDGVLNSTQYAPLNSAPGSAVPAARPDARSSLDSGELDGEHPWMVLDPAAVQRVDAICRATRAVVVISSSWRHQLSLDEMRTVLKIRGFTGEVIDATTKKLRPGPDECWSWGEQRGKEISAWLEEHPAPPTGKRRYIVLDDDVIEGHETHQVKTDMTTGLLDEHRDAAVGMLVARFYDG